jgi:hypothetical protein
MAKFKYIGEDDREFPTLGLTVNAGDVFDAPSDFVATNVIVVPKTTPSADTTVGE